DSERVHAGSERQAVLRVVEQLFDAPRADLRPRDLQRRLVLEKRMRAIQERSGFILVVPERLAERDDPGQALRAFALLLRELRPALERGRRHYLVDEGRHRSAALDRASREQL